MAALLLAGACIGALAALLITRDLRLKTGRKGLEQYAQRMLGNADAVAAETSLAINTVREDKLTFCSDEELSLMRRLVFKMSYVKDIGRPRDGRLVCSTGLGRVGSPLHGVPPSLTSGKLQMYIHTPTVIDADAESIVLQYEDVSVIVNPEEGGWRDELPMTLSVLLYDRPDQKVLVAHGHPEPLSAADVVRQRMVERAGIVYQPLCSAKYSVCIVAAESHAAMVTRDKIYNVIPLGAGVLLGVSLALSLVLFLHRQRSLDRRLRRAIRNNELTVVYQPIVDLRTHVIVGAEALARWTSESSEVVHPEVFIAAAEQSGFIHEVTQFVLRCAIEEVGDLLRLGSFELTVNVTTHDLASPGFCDRLHQDLKAAKIDPRAFGFELTERSTADRGVVRDAIARLRSLGCRVYIDDFGTGYSSLAYLQELGADGIKIDRTFTATVGTEAVTASVVPQILDIARRLNLMVVVEGIETEHQALYFRRAGGDILGQGWLFGRPVPAAQLKAQVRGASRVMG